MHILSILYSFLLVTSKLSDRKSYAFYTSVYMGSKLTLIKLDRKSRQWPPVSSKQLFRREKQWPSSVQWRCLSYESSTCTNRKKNTKTTWSDRNREREPPHLSLRSAGVMCQGTVPIGPPCYCPHHNTLWSCITAPHTPILSASCTRVDFFSGIQRDILLRTKPFLVFYNSSPLAGARQWVQCNKNNPSPTAAMTGNADTNASCTHSRCPGTVTHR